MDSWIEIKTGWRKQKKGNSSGCLHIHIRCFWISLVCSQYFVVILIFPFLHRNQRHASHLNLLAWVLSIHWNPYRVLCRWTRLVNFDNVWKVGKLLTFISLFKQYCSSWAQVWCYLVFLLSQSRLVKGSKCYQSLAVEAGCYGPRTISPEPDAFIVRPPQGQFFQLI